MFSHHFLQIHKECYWKGATFTEVTNKYILGGGQNKTTLRQLYFEYIISITHYNLFLQATTPKISDAYFDKAQS